MKKYLAIDIGASSGRHIVGYMEDGNIKLEEVYRFSNGMKQKDGHLIWDEKEIFRHILAGLRKAKELGHVPVSIGIDTWAVDYALLDEDDKLINDIYGYRDNRTEGADEEVYKIIPEEELYARTGIQKQIFNTIYQLKSEKNLDKASSMLMIPDYFNFLLTGKKAQEYTNASTTQLVSPITKNWDFELINKLGLREEIFNKIYLPGTILGNLKEEIQKEVGYDAEVIMVASHDTASAVLSVPSNEDSIYISSGTWSLMGTELMEANCSKRSKELNFTNEGGVDYRFRYLKNIMGMWMINETRNEIGKEYSFSEICDKARDADIDSIVDASDVRFLAPVSMFDEVKKACAETNQKVPTNLAEAAKVIYMSLAECYKKTALEIEEMTGKSYPCIHIVGGGCKATYLNELTAKATGKTVYAGPDEATSIGNIVCQMMANKEIDNLLQARNLIFKSFGVKEIKGE